VVPLFESAAPSSYLISSMSHFRAEDEDAFFPFDNREQLALSLKFNGSECPPMNLSELDAVA
jgi:hypothetical protein